MRLFCLVAWIAMTIEFERPCGAVALPQRNISSTRNIHGSGYIARYIGYLHMFASLCLTTSALGSRERCGECAILTVSVT